ncbi:MAG: serine hydrolase [Bacteroidota bacterium]|nr:serine hydrolase [Bacteroidota bacterium]
MKKILILLLLSVGSICHAQQQKIDSICNLVKKYFNEKNSDSLYALTGNDFRKALSADAFTTICDNNLFPLGEMNQAVFESNDEGIATYKTIFNVVNLTMLLSLDKSDKIQIFLFKPYVEERAKKNYKVPSTNALKTPFDREVDSAVQPYISLQATAGLSIGILRNGKITFYGYGETARGNKQIPDEHTIFEIGSVSKTFTAILLALAVDNGKAKLDDPLSKYLPDSIPPLAYEGVPVTLETMSNHSSGIPGMPTNFQETDPGNPYKNYDVNDLFSFYKHYQLTRKPGTKYEYSNLAVGTLGVVLEKIYNEKYAALITQYICKPLGMDETEEFLQKKDSSHFAKGYNEDGAYNSQWDFKALQSAGSIRATAHDLVRYAKANLGDAPPHLWKAMELTHKITFTEGNTKVGLGWHYIKPGKDEVLFHNGETGGYHCYVAININKKFAVVILSNCSRGTEDVGGHIMKWLEENN